uniref:Flagellar hook-associated protein 1 n=1 Tax=Rhodopseudomonas palustris (strain BisA53) TaxID=316055 RepID=Q07RI0_RHOP5
MSLGDALSIAMAGLRANQASMSLVSSNVANAETPGYVRKTIDQVTTNSGSVGSGVRVYGVNRQLDEYIQAQVRTETSGAGYTTLKSDFLQQLQSIYGNPDNTGTLENAFNGLTTAIQALSTSPESQSARLGVLNAAQVMAQQLNSMTQGIQSLRNSCEIGLDDSVNYANNLMSQIAVINNNLQANPLGGTSTTGEVAALLDQRDQYITELSQLMDIRVTFNSANQVTIFTPTGIQLVGNEAAHLEFNAQGTVNPATTYDTTASKSTLGAVTISYANGGSIDLTNSIKSGKIAAYVELRDKLLVEAQTQVDQFAATMSSALSDKTTDGVDFPVTIPPAVPLPRTGSQLDLTDLKSGNTINLTYTDALGAKKTLTIVRVDDPSVLPLSNTATVNPNDTVLGIDFSGGIAAAIAQLNANTSINADLRFSGTQAAFVVENNLAGTSNVDTASATTTVSSLTSGSPQLQLFTDNGATYTGAITAQGSQMTGLAGRISVNNALIADPSKLITFATPTKAGDTTRPDFLTKQLTATKFQYSAQTGIGSTGTPYTGTLLSFLQQVTSTQGATAAAAAQIADGQNVVLNTLQKKLSTQSGVNMDEEMAHLLALQNAYSANARVMSTVNDMYKTLMQAF